MECIAESQGRGASALLLAPVDAAIPPEHSELADPPHLAGYAVLAALDGV